MSTPNSPLRAVPLRIVLITVAVASVGSLFQGIRNYGWPPYDPASFWVETLSGGLFGGYVIAWILWRVWLHKLAPDGEPYDPAHSDRSG